MFSLSRRQSKFAYLPSVDRSVLWQQHCASTTINNYYGMRIVSLAASSRNELIIALRQWPCGDMLKRVIVAISYIIIYSIYSHHICAFFVSFAWKLETIRCEHGCALCEASIKCTTRGLFRFSYHMIHFDYREEIPKHFGSCRPTSP